MRVEELGAGPWCLGFEHFSEWRPEGHDHRIGSADDETLRELGGVEVGFTKQPLRLGDRLVDLRNQRSRQIGQHHVAPTLHEQRVPEHLA